MNAIHFRESILSPDRLERIERLGLYLKRGYIYWRLKLERIVWELQPLPSSHAKTLFLAFCPAKTLSNKNLNLTCTLVAVSDFFHYSLIPLQDDFLNAYRFLY